jgi:hypothetical protein
MKRALAVPATLLALATAGCGAFYVEGEITETCITLPSMTVPITAAAGSTGTFSREVNFGLQNAIPDFVLQGDAGERSLRLLRLELSVPPGQLVGANLDWLTSAQLRVMPPPGSPLPSQTLVQYAQGPSSLPILTVTVQPTGEANLADYLAQNQLALYISGEVEFPTGLPATETLTVTGCFYAKVHETLQQLIDASK